jgi:hypothetical protein
LSLPVEKTVNIETRIGLYWLHKLGIVSLVLGMSFLLMYSFQFFGATLKLLLGFGVAAALIYLGRRMSRKERQQWFAYGLTAGGWSLAYFTTYAAYYLPAVKVIHSLSLETVLLIAVAAGSLLSALRARSQIMAIYSVTLAAASILFSGPSLLSDISFVVIALACAILGNRQAWKQLIAFGLGCCYIGHVYCSYAAGNFYELTIAASFLAAIWLVFSVGLGYSLQSTQPDRTFTTILSVINALALFFGLALFSFSGISETAQILFACAGAVYLSAARWSFRRKENQLSSVYALLGLSMINVAKVMHFSGLTMIAVDIIEIGLLAVIGAKFRIRVFRWFAIFLTLLLYPICLASTSYDFAQAYGFSAFAHVRIAIYAAAMLGGLAWFHMQRNIRRRLPIQYVYFYDVAANVMSAFVIWHIVNPAWAAAAFVLQMILNHMIAIKLKNGRFAIPGIVVAFFASNLLSENTAWQTVPIATIVVMLYAAHAYCRIRALPATNELAVFQPIYACAANLMLTLFILKQVPSQYISAALGCEGIFLLLGGFLLSDAVFRTTALGILGLLTTKLLFMDFAKFDTLERIISFIVAGVVFLLSSYAYARFTHSFEEQASGSEGDASV